MPQLPISVGRAAEATRFAILRTLPAPPAVEIAMTLMILGLVLFLTLRLLRNLGFFEIHEHPPSDPEEKHS